ncbi:ATP-grasp domain-containing protein [Adhaeretor mobilis]|uniref:Carbamoyl phosphate synthase-like protein n=1 Tax=Adhaeretor mobilis TaxID=1930276 RepID=A0A517MWZ0_9BACT|nr:ATP-grasp domain-containing protein [Adhaeretor mobilis]QDS99405.1 carbamoyl phosphate synthase-like protein [Adhaeretor mobilis]
MHVFLYEWVTGGGLVEESGRLPSSLLAEGAAMASALAADFLQLTDSRVTVLRDLRLDEPAYTGCEIIEVHSSAQQFELLAACAEKADYTLAIAPEFDRHLHNTVAHLQSGSSISLNAGLEFINLTADKRATAERLAIHAVPVPQATLVRGDEERLPDDFPYPAVLKPVDGAGSQHTLRVEGALDQPDPHPWPRRLEQYILGRPASVLFICGPSGETPLPPCWQRLSTDGRFQYLGGSLILVKALAQRATDLASRALSALAPVSGFIGVDLILGEATNGSEDFVIEVNPRVTTSYAGLRAVVKENLAGMAIAAATGSPITPTSRGIPLEFTADGQITLP